MVGLIREITKRIGCGCLAVLLSGLVLSPARAVIETLTTLEKFAADADLILVAKVERLDLEQGRLVLAVESHLKGKDAAANLPARLAGNANQALAGVKPGDSAVLFVSKGDQQDLAYVYVQGAWFHLVGTHDQDKVRWQFKAGEPYLRRTYSDETAQLVQLLTAKLAGTGGLPAPDATLEPGYGLVPGKHPAPAQQAAANVTASPATASAPKSSAYGSNFPLVLATAVSAIVIVIMLTRSKPLEDADG